VRPFCSVLVLITASACHPSASVEHTTPVANLQTYRTIGLRVQSSTYASSSQAAYLESAVISRLEQQCGFEQVARFGAAPTDVILDLNVTDAGRGSTGWISNPGVARLDALLVLSDGLSGELLGTARIHGRSSGIMINYASPEIEAVDVVAKTIAELLAKSGCAGPRIARATPPVQTAPIPPSSTTTTTTNTVATSDPATTTNLPLANSDKRAQAETLNDQGKDKLRSADIAGALASFQQANQLAPDPRYQYNICLTYEAQEQWDAAIGSCRQARAMTPDAQLGAKIDHRLDLLAQRRDHPP
jgi:hypothetical protein